MYVYIYIMCSTTIVYIYMYACMHACMYVCMYVCMHACMYAWMYAWMYVCMYLCMYVCMHACMYLCMHACMYVCMYAWMYVCIQIPCTFRIYIILYIQTIYSLSLSLNINIYIWARSPDPHTPPNGIPPPLLTPPAAQNLVFACYLHIYIHIYTYILPFPPLQPRISTLFAALESHDLVNGPCLPVYFYHSLFFEPPIACLAHGLQHICYLWITQSLPMQT